MEISQLKPIVEAMIFVSEEPITDGALLIALQDAGVDKDELRMAVDAIRADYDGVPERGITLAEVAGGYQFRTKQTNAEWVRRLNVPKPLRLSQPALETLAIVAYKQPIVRSEIEKIRGVDSGGVLKTLLERKILRIVGRQDEPGQPLLYGTTKEFLEVFNLKTLKELPALRDVEDLLRERKAETSSRRPDSMVQMSEGDERADEVPSEDAVSVQSIERYALDADGEAEKEDMEALADLETNLKDLRRLERTIFPKPLPGEGPIEGEGTENAEDASGQFISQAEGAPHPFERGADTDEGASGEDAPAEDGGPRQ